MSVRSPAACVNLEIRTIKRTIAMARNLSQPDSRIFVNNFSYRIAAIAHFHENSSRHFWQCISHSHLLVTGVHRIQRAARCWIKPASCAALRYVTLWAADDKSFASGACNITDLTTEIRVVR